MRKQSHCPINMSSRVKRRGLMVGTKNPPSEEEEERQRAREEHQTRAYGGLRSTGEGASTGE